MLNDFWKTKELGQATQKVTTMMQKLHFQSTWMEYILYTHNHRPIFYPLPLKFTQDPHTHYNRNSHENALKFRKMPSYQPILKKTPTKSWGAWS